MRQKDTQGRYTLSLLMTIHIFLFIDVQKQSLKSVVSMEKTFFGFQSLVSWQCSSSHCLLTNFWTAKVIFAKWVQILQLHKATNFNDI